MCEKRLVIMIGIILLAIMVSAGVSEANLVVNGDFEIGPIVGSGGFVTLAKGSTSVTGWTVMNSPSGGIDYVKDALWADASYPGGHYSIDLNAASAGGIQQTLATEAGQSYIVKFFLSGNSAGLPLEKRVRVTAWWSDVFSHTVVLDSTRPYEVSWEEKSFMFTTPVGSTTTLLSFSSEINGAYGPAIDNVRVEAVPEPISIFLGIMGFGSVAGLRKLCVRQRTA